MRLFLKECRQILKSIIYFTFVAIAIMFYTTQLANFAGRDIKQAQEGLVYTPNNPLLKPPVGEVNYGIKQEEIPEQIMQKALQELISEYTENNYLTYPLGFYKNVKLNENEHNTVKSILNELTEGEINANMPVIISADYELFSEKMAEVDKILGGGSAYTPYRLLMNGQVPVTYEEKLAEYNTFINEEKITNAYARLFCDYMGIVIALFGIFVPVSFLLRDSKAQINELIYSRRKNSAAIVFTRYFAVVAMSILPIILLSLIPTLQLIQYGNQSGINVDAFAFIKYIFAWLLPTLMTTTSIGFFFTILTGTPIAILIQLSFSFISMQTGIANIYGGNYGLELFIRHNTLGNYEAVKMGFEALAFNRIMYVVLSLILLTASAFIYEQKRKGRINIESSLHKILSSVKGAG